MSLFTISPRKSTQLLTAARGTSGHQEIKVGSINCVENRPGKNFLKRGQGRKQKSLCSSPHYLLLSTPLSCVLRGAMPKGRLMVTNSSWDRMDPEEFHTFLNCPLNRFKKILTKKKKKEKVIFVCT